MATLLAVVLFVSPCKLVTPAQAAVALGGAVGKPTVQTLGNFRSCSYAAGTAFLTVQTRALSKADFVESAKANPPPVKPVSIGSGTVAYSASGFSVLVWRNGTEATFSIVHGGGIPAAIALAKKVAAKI